MDIFKRSGGGDSGSSASNDDEGKKEEFEDLGRSVRLKEIEKGFQDVPKKSVEEDQEDSAMKEFEKNWFAFLEE